jgi:hypothetical protein
LRTLVDMDFLGLDWRADARVRFAMAKTPVFAVFWNGSASRTGAVLRTCRAVSKERHAVKDYFPVSANRAEPRLMRATAPL